jgi:hypothetical protein
VEQPHVGKREQLMTKGEEAGTVVVVLLLCASVAVFAYVMGSYMGEQLAALSTENYKEALWACEAEYHTECYAFHACVDAVIGVSK